MSAFIDPAVMLQTFTGTAAIFPLPNVVLFPQALLPLHIFEPRYRQMTADVLSGERFLAMALLKPETGSPPPVHDVVGLGKVVAYERLESGRYHLVLRGVARARVCEELSTSRPYRQARLELLSEEAPSAAEQREWIEKLLARFEALFPVVRDHPLWHEVTRRHVPLGMVCDLLASSLPIPAVEAQVLLAETRVVERCQMLLELLKHASSLPLPSKPVPKPQRVFPPEFSWN